MQVPEGVLMLILPVTHTVITYCFQAPDCPRGYTGPGGSFLDGKWSGSEARGGGKDYGR